MRTRGTVLALAVLCALASMARAETEPSSLPDEPRLVRPDRASGSATPFRSRALKPSIMIPSDTVYVGFTPGRSGDNYWSIGSGSNSTSPPGPYHRPPQRGAMWDFESPVGGDSLQGWWPYRNQMNGAAGMTLPDHERTWRSLDYGNNANYVMGAGKTFGVVGVWHVDGGNTVVVPSGSADGQFRSLTPNFVDPGTGATTETDGGVKWAPLQGTRSAWMGLRRHGDASHVDPLTGNPFNESVLQFNFNNPSSTGGTDKRFPGYGAQMDQMLYRDVIVPAGATQLEITFSYRTAMSTSFITTAATRAGWFQNDPLTVSYGGPSPNYIQSTGVATPPVDSFMVYVGAPAEGSVILSDGNTHSIFDPKRRWFGEVVRSNEGHCKQVFSKGGTQAATTVTVGLGGADLANLKALAANRVRIVFRVKTNQAFDDETFGVNSYSSGGVGAAILDGVTLSTNLGSLAFAGTVQGAFESVTDIDNTVAVDALNAWKSTGKPPKPFHHVHQLSPSAGLVYEDILGQVGSPNRICNMVGQVVSAGDHDDFETTGGQFGTAEQEPFQGMFSPVINLATPAGGGENNMGLSLDDVTTVNAGDYFVDYEIYTGVFDFFNTGNAWRVGFQSYPAANNATGEGQHKRWGEVRFAPFISFEPEKRCFRDMVPMRSSGTIRTSNGSGVPDSCRIYVGVRQETYRFGIPTSQHYGGAYWDNVSLAIVDGATPREVTIEASALTDQRYRISPAPGATTAPCTTGVQTLTLGEGVNYFQSCDLGGEFAFEVDGDGNVDYASEYEAFLDGAGTNVLVVNGYPIDVDASTLGFDFQIGTGPCFPDVLQTLHLIPGTYGLDACIGSGCEITHEVEFGVEADGDVSYDPIHEGPLDGAGTSTLGVRSLSFPPPGDDLAISIGKFRIVVDPDYWDLMEGYPGYGVVNGVHRLVSPNLVDFSTRIGRSSLHRHGDGADVGGTPVGTDATIVADSDFSAVPPGFQGPANALEVHTELRSLHLSGGGVTVRAGTEAPGHPVSSFSPGEIEAGAGVQGLFPAESFFDVFVEIDLSVLGTLYNTEALVVENSGITCFPPQVVYLHRHTGPVPVAFKHDDGLGRWQAGDRFGWLVLAGHGYDFDTTTTAAMRVNGTTDPFAAFEALVNAEPEMADTATAVVDLHDVLTFSDSSAYADPGYRDSLAAGIATAAALGQAGDPCAGTILISQLYARVDGRNQPDDWVTDDSVRATLANRIHLLGSQLQMQANQSGGCLPTAVPPAVAPARVAIVAVQPNPSRGTTTIAYAIPSAGRVRLAVYDASGRLVRKLLDGDLPAGTHTAYWDGAQDRTGGRTVRSGTYFLVLEAAGVTQTKKVAIVR